MTSLQFPWLQLAQSAYADFVQELGRYGIYPAPELQITERLSALGFYDHETCTIGIPAFGANNAAGKFQMMMMRSVLFPPSDAALLEFLQLLLPYTVAHELTHHLRHHYGRFAADPWHEELVANELALALVKRRMTPQQRAYACSFLQHALEQLALAGAQQMQGVAFPDLLTALHARGQLDERQVRLVRVLHRLLDRPPQDVIRAGLDGAHDLEQYLLVQAETVTALRDTYSSDVSRYLIHQIEWLYLALNSPDHRYIDRWACRHLWPAHEPLALKHNRAIPQAEQVRACWAASHACGGHATPLGRYFYRRYRELLVMLIKHHQPDFPLQDVLALLPIWGRDDGAAEVLVYLAATAPAELLPLFPDRLTASALGGIQLPAMLPEAADHRLWRYHVDGQADAQAELTVQHLTWLERSSMMRSLSAALLIDLAQRSSAVFLCAGETLLWQGEQISDVFILAEGTASVIYEAAEREQLVGILEAGAVVGVRTFFTFAPRAHSIRARTDCVWLALGTTDLRRATLQDPVLALRLAEQLAQRIGPIAYTETDEYGS